jgi:glycosyltransferase involved in cell wall biosynthesis
MGDFTDPIDEGMKNVAYNLAINLSKAHKVLALNPKYIYVPHFWSRLKKFRPEIICYVPGPSFLSFMIVKATYIYCTLHVSQQPKVAMMALHPLLPFPFDRISILLRPDLILAQSLESERIFRKIGLHTRFLPIGVDVEKFVPIAPSRKTSLRRKYGLKEDEFIILHVGSVRKNRGLEVLSRVQMNKGNRVLIIGSTSMPIDRSVHMKLTDSGCLVWRRYFEEIEELYQLADLYVFPVVDRLGSIELPLSVLEAMACNLPVISTKFGALPRIFKEGKGLTFINKTNEIPLKIEQIKNSHLVVKTREKVLPYAWERVTQLLTKYFCQLLEEYA